MWGLPPQGLFERALREECSGARLGRTPLPTQPTLPPLLGPATWPVPSPEGQRTAVLSLKDGFSLQLEFIVANSLVFAVCQLGSSPQVALLLSPGILLHGAFLTQRTDLRMLWARKKS